jgi:phosphatidylglycerophosphatase C
MHRSRGAQQDRTVAAFDFDCTISTADSLQCFVRCAILRRRFGLAVAATLPWLIAVSIGVADPGKTKARFLDHARPGLFVEDLQFAIDRFCSVRSRLLVQPVSAFGNGAPG